MKGGVQEISGRNGAVAEFSVSDFTFEYKGKGTKTISTGKGTVAFSHNLKERGYSNILLSATCKRLGFLRQISKLNNFNKA